MLFGCNGTGWKFIDKSPLELLNIVLEIAACSCELQELHRINLTKSFNVNRSPVLVDSMMPLRVVSREEMQIGCLLELFSSENIYYTIWPSAHPYCVSTKFLSPLHLQHISPHLLCFLSIKFPGLQKSAGSTKNNTGLTVKNIMYSLNVECCLDTKSRI